MGTLIKGRFEKNMRTGRVGRARKRFRLSSAGIGFAAAGFLIFGQAGAAHAPVGPAPVAAAVSAVLPAAGVKSAQQRFSAEPFRKLRAKIPAAAPRLSPTLGEGSYAELQVGAIRYPDGAVTLPDRSKPLPAPQEVDPMVVGHAVSVPSAIRMAETFDVYPQQSEGAAGHGHTPAFAGLPLVSSAHAAEAAGPRPHPMGGPVSRMPIQGHILFEKDTAALSRTAQMQLEKLLKTLNGSHAALEIVAYAGRKGSESSEARRLSLRRGLAVRSYLIRRGIDQKRISVRPLGGVRDDGPKARVDVFHASY